MIDGIEQSKLQAELRRDFVTTAAAAEQEAERTGKAYDARQVFDYLEARACGFAAEEPCKVRPPRPVPFLSKL